MEQWYAAASSLASARSTDVSIQSFEAWSFRIVPPPVGAASRVFKNFSAALYTSLLVTLVFSLREDPITRFQLRPCRRRTRMREAGTFQSPCLMNSGATVPDFVAVRLETFLDRLQVISVVIPIRALSKHRVS